MILFLTEKVYGRKGIKYYVVKYIVRYIEKQKEMIDVIKQYKALFHHLLY